MSTLEQLKASRASKKGYITRIGKIIEDENIRLNATDLRCRMELLEGYFSNFLATQDGIDALLPEESAEEEYRAKVEDLYCSIKSKILTRIANLDKVASKPSAVHTSTDDLPKLKPPVFSGDYTEYNNFIQQFRATIDTKPIPTIRKFQLLVDECLKGEAKLTVKSLDVIEENYTTALELLKTRYDNKCIVFQTHIRGLYHLAPVAKNSGPQLRRFVDSIDGHLGALRSLGTDTDIVNALLIHIASLKLDNETYKKWEDTLELNQLPSWNQCSSFLNKRSQHLDIRDSQSKPLTSPALKSYTSSTEGKRNSRQGSALAVTELRCSFCNAPHHTISDCSRFTKLKVFQRFQAVKRLALCINCLQSGHMVKDCPAEKCKVCGEPHHSILHRFQVAASSSNIRRASDSDLNGVESNAHVMCKTTLHSADAQENASNHVFLATAVVLVRGATGEYIPTRALLDSGSQLNLISEHLSQKLRLKRTNFSGELSGIGNINCPARQKTSVSLRSRLNKFETNLDCWILSSITSNQPDMYIDVTDWSIPSDIELADPNFNRPQRIDMLIGAVIFFDLLAEGQIKLGTGIPLFRNTVLGWIVVGQFKPQVCNMVSNVQVPSKISHSNVAVDLDSLDYLLKKFFEIEEIRTELPNWTEEQIACEKIFCDTIRQRADGRLVVQLPFKENPGVLGDSRRTAEKRFLSLEKRIERTPEIKQMYVAFMREYESLGHMEAVPQDEIINIKYYMPHQCVLRPDSSSTKLRVVFDASCRTSTNISLNEILMVGPTVQQDLYSISLRFRLHRIAFTADVPKMYRQIFVRPNDANFQAILWREHANTEIKVYRLTTVTYGTSSAPYHATRCLLYLAEKHQQKFPLASAVIKRDFYIDDLISGADTLEEAENIRFQVESILSSAGLELKKWYSNDAKLMDKIPSSDQETTLRINESDVIRALGIVWEPSKDELKFVNPLEGIQHSENITKRTVLADVARLFDPLGLVNPVIVLGKIFLQRLWIAKVGWDEDIGEDLKREWMKYRLQLCELTKLHVPRYIFSKDAVCCELHGFSDASLKAYGCCLYVRTQDGSGNISVHLLSAKSKVAPVSTQSLPRLELCAAMLLSRLLRRVLDAFENKFDRIVLWTDSEVVLDWLADHPSSWNTFVANRVSIIQELTGDAIWRYVDTKSNPADIISRGAVVANLLDSIWFQGPEFLYHESYRWPVTGKRASKNVPERRKINSVLIGTTHNNSTEIETEDIVEKTKFVNNYRKTVRVFAYCNRFIESCKRAVSRQYRNNVVRGELSAGEYKAALTRIVFCIQQSRFRNEIASLNSRDCVGPKSRIRKLNPFLQADTMVPYLLRVGGRLELSELPYNAKHPILLPNSHPFVLSYLQHIHLKNYHAGAQALVSIARQMFWIIDARNLGTKIVHNCLRCFRMRPRLREQIMGDLPAPRNVQSSIHRICAEDNIEFHHIPPRSPHFGGLWESAVKSAKSLLIRTCSPFTLTYEELSTVAAEIEAILNSRPITPLTSDPSDEQALTPGHFIIGSPLTSFPEPDVTDVSCLRRWQQLSYIRQHFWKRWSREYVVQLQHRYKWNARSDDVKPGMMVLISDDNLPPQKWLLGRIAETIPSRDGHVRVVNIKTKNGIISRAVHKIAPLPYGDFA